MCFIFNIHIVPSYVKTGDNFKADVLLRVANPSIVPVFRQIFSV